MCESCQNSNRNKNIFSIFKFLKNFFFKGPMWPLACALCLYYGQLQQPQMIKNITQSPSGVKNTAIIMWHIFHFTFCSSQWHQLHEQEQQNIAIYTQKYLIYHFICGY